MSKPRALTPERLAEAALAVIDESGLAAFSLRAVAERLGVGTASLCQYVEDREHLEALVVERILSAVSLDLPPAPWRNRVELLVDRVRRAVAAHPQAVPLALVHRRNSPSTRGWAEAVLEVLAEAGIEGERRVVALRALLSYLIGSLELDYRGSLFGVGTRMPGDLPRADYPYLAATARLAQRLSPAEEFRGGLALLLDGIAASLPTRGTR